MLANKTLILLAVYLSATRHLIDSEMSECPAGRIPVLMVADLNAKHVGSSSRLIKTRSRLWYAYFKEDSFVIERPDTPKTVPYKYFVINDIPDILIKKNVTII
jgi:hypothetical protein